MAVLALSVDDNVHSFEIDVTTDVNTTDLVPAGKFTRALEIVFSTGHALGPIQVYVLARSDDPDPIPLRDEVGNARPTLAPSSLPTGVPEDVALPQPYLKFVGQAAGKLIIKLSK